MSEISVMKELNIDPGKDKNDGYRSSRPVVFLEKGVLKYAANLQKNTHTNVRFH